MGKNKVIEVQNINVTVSEENFDDYICITDIAKAKVGESRGADVIKNWMRNRVTLEFLVTWEQGAVALSISAQFLFCVKNTAGPRKIQLLV